MLNETSVFADGGDAFGFGLGNGSDDEGGMSSAPSGTSAHR